MLVLSHKMTLRQIRKPNGDAFATPESGSLIPEIKAVALATAATCFKKNEEDGTFFMVPYTIDEMIHVLTEASKFSNIFIKYF